MVSVMSLCEAAYSEIYDSERVIPMAILVGPKGREQNSFAEAC